MRIIVSGEAVNHVKKNRGPKSDTMDIRYTVRMDRDDADRINNYCKETGKSRSDVLREAVMNHLNDEKIKKRK